MSAYPPGTAPVKGNFPPRNRIVSGLSDAIVVVEAAVRSGTSITVSMALEQGRDVFAVPGNIDQPNSIGVNKLIADGAFPIMQLDGIEELLGIGRGRIARMIESFSDEEKIVIGSIIEAPGISAEEIALRSGLSLRECSLLASALELKGFIRSEGSRLFVIK